MFGSNLLENGLEKNPATSPIRFRDIDVLVSTGSRFLKPEVDTQSQTHKNIYIFGIRRPCWLKKYILFSNWSKIEKFGKNEQILVRHFEYLMSYDFLKKLYSNDPYQNEDNLKSWWKSVNIYAWFHVLRKITNFSWYDFIKNDDVTILRSAQLEQIS